MANEITIKETITVSNGNFKDTFAPGTLFLDQATATGGNPGTVNVGTSEQDISFGDVTPNLVVMRNMDSTNYVKYGPKSGGSMIEFGRLKPGTSARFILAPSVTLRMVANAAACKVLIKGYSA